MKTYLLDTPEKVTWANERRRDTLPWKLGDKLPVTFHITTDMIRREYSRTHQGAPTNLTEDDFPVPDLMLSIDEFAKKQGWPDPSLFYIPAWAETTLVHQPSHDKAELEVLREFYKRWEALHAIPPDKFNKKKREDAAQSLVEQAHILRRMKASSGS